MSAAAYIPAASVQTHRRQPQQQPPPQQQYLRAQISTPQAQALTQAQQAAIQSSPLVSSVPIPNQPTNGPPQNPNQAVVQNMLPLQQQQAQQQNQQQNQPSIPIMAAGGFPSATVAAAAGLLPSGIPGTPGAQGGLVPAGFNQAAAAATLAGAAAMNLSRMPGAAIPQLQAQLQQGGPGQGVLRLLQYNEQLPKGAQAADINFWRKFIADFYSENGVMKYELVDPIKSQKRNFELTTALLPRFYQINFDSGVQSIQMTIEDSKDYLLSTGAPIVECGLASLYYHFRNGCLVVARGRLRVTFSPAFKIDTWEFWTAAHTEYIPRSAVVPRESQQKSPAMETKEGVMAKIQQQGKQQQGEGSWDYIPESSVNEFGITLKAMRCLEIAEVVGRMKDLITYSVSTNTGPIQSLAKLAQRFREQPRLPNQPGMISNPLVGNGIIQPGGLGNPSGSIVGGSVMGDGSGSPSSPSTKKRPLPGGADSGGSGPAGGNAREDGAGGAVTASPTAQTRVLDNGAGGGMLNGAAGAGKAGSPQMNNTQLNKSPVL
ncbi:LIM-domain binding protein-domain-containing protein, partial [Endogone sp. FLAS-F59071]